MAKLQRGDTLVLASNNASKLVEIRAICEPYGLKLVPIGDYTKDEPVEDGGTFEANALIKARAAAKISGIVSIADDSGISLPVLGGKPGVDTKPFSDQCGSYEAATKTLLAEAGAESTSAKFTSILALVWPDGHEEIIEGTLHGTLAFPGRGTGWGYTAYFTPDGLDETLAMMTPEAKNKISHRGQAFQKFIDQFVA